jgi:hypothetical protein
MCGQTSLALHLEWQHWIRGANSPQQPEDSGKGKHNYSCMELMWDFIFSRRLISESESSDVTSYRSVNWYKTWRTLLSVFRVMKRGGSSRCNFGACLLYYNCIWSRSWTFPIGSFCKMTMKMLNYSSRTNWKLKAFEERVRKDNVQECRLLKPAATTSDLTYENLCPG